MSTIQHKVHNIYNIYYIKLVQKVVMIVSKFHQRNCTEIYKLPSYDRKRYNQVIGSGVEHKLVFLLKLSPVRSISSVDMSDTLLQEG